MWFAGSAEQVTSAVPAAHGVQDGEGHRYALAGKAAQLRSHHFQSALNFPEIPRVDSPLEAADDRLRDQLKSFGERRWGYREAAA
jgi:hypothetical protein